MLHLKKVADKTIIQKVSQRLARAGAGGKSQITATVHNGQLTLSGTLQYENQRRPAIIAARGAEGVRNVIDNLQVKAKPKKWS